MSAVPKKKRRGRPRGSKNKPKVAVPPETKEALQPYQQVIVAGLESDNPASVIHARLAPESSFVAGYFGLDKIEGEALNQALAEKICEERRAACIQENLAEGEPVQDDLPESEYRRIYDETIAPVIERLEQEEAGDLHAGSDFANLTFEGVHVSVDNVTPDPKPIAHLDIPNIPTVWVETDSFASEELKSILRQIDAKVKDLASYPMDHGLRCGMNEVEILLANNREKFSK